MALTFPDIDPVALAIGPLEIRWYALSYIAGILIGWWLIKRLQTRFSSPFLTADLLDDLITWIVLGIILGGRLGYVLFYNVPYFLENPVEIFMVWQGGMAFHGGLIGVIVAIVGFAWKNDIPFFALADRVAAVVPIGIFFGRIANFINGELFGRASDLPWAMIFYDGDVARHPSQLYQAGTEGLCLFIALMILIRNKTVRESYGVLSGAFLSLYGIMRFFVEYTREPDAHIGLFSGGLSMGQILCIPMIIIGLSIIGYVLKKNNDHKTP